jgi:hypothetical protein
MFIWFGRHPGPAKSGLPDFGRKGKGWGMNCETEN